MENAMLKIKYKMLIYFDHMDVFFFIYMADVFKTFKIKLTMICIV